MTSFTTQSRDSYYDVFKSVVACKCSHRVWSILTACYRTGAERDREYKRTDVYLEHVLYYDLASGCLDVRSTGSIYGLKNLYRDASNPSDVNELEEKLSTLEREASVVIGTLHSKLPPARSPLNAAMLNG